MLTLKTADNLTKIWSFPWKTEFTVCISFSLSTSDETSQTDPVILRFKALHCNKHSLSSASFREQVWTAAPNLASSSTMACLITRKER
ncbi:unnamed protein product, partial [Musa textilis]